MKFIYTAGNYTQFMGRTFAFKKSTEVTDKATIDALLRNKDFVQVDEEVKPTPVIPFKRPILSLRKK